MARQKKTRGRKRKAFGTLPHKGVEALSYNDRFLSRIWSARRRLYPADEPDSNRYIPLTGETV